MGIGLKISELIGKNKLTKKYVCEQLPVARPTLDDWISGRTSPTVDYLFKLCDILDCSIHDFLDDPEEKYYSGLDRAFADLKLEIKRYIDIQIKTAMTANNKH